MKKYVSPEIEITKAEASDVLNTSPNEVIKDVGGMFGDLWD